jgi:hypothetical protein
LREHYQLYNYCFLDKKHKDAILLGSADLLAWVWQRNYKDAEAAEKSGQEDPGWTKPFRLLLPDEESPPICSNHLGQKRLKSMALWVVLQQLQLGEPHRGKGSQLRGAQRRAALSERTP